VGPDMFDRDAMRGHCPTFRSSDASKGRDTSTSSCLPSGAPAQPQAQWKAGSRSRSRVAA
jgi:hypothetical protein